MLGHRQTGEYRLHIGQFFVTFYRVPNKCMHKVTNITFSLPAVTAIPLFTFILLPL
jgi:hypothetical protein